MAFMRLLTCLITALACSGVCLAEDVLQRIPKGALGFVLVRNLDDAGNKVEQLIKPFGLTTPNPVVLARVATGLGVGLDTDGDFALAFLPNGSPTDLLPLVLLPVTDYELFAKSIQADPSGDICQASLLGEDILVTRAGDFAMLMNLEQRAVLELLVAQPPAELTSLKKISSWLSEQDVAMVVMPGGLTQLSRWKPPRTSRVAFGTSRRQQKSFLAEWSAVIESQQLRNWLRMYTTATAIGVTVDDAGNVRVGERAVLRYPFQLENETASNAGQSSTKFGLLAEPYVVAGGGSVPSNLRKFLAAYLLKTEKSQAAQNGLEQISKELWAKEENAYRLLLEEVTDCSIFMLPGEKGEPLLGNFLGLVTVADVTGYFDSLGEVVETWTEMTEQSTSDIKPSFELESSTVGRQQRRELVVDVATTARDPNVPEFNWMLEAIFGPEGKLRMQFWQIDEKRFLFGLATRDQMAKAFQRIAGSDEAAASGIESLTTAKLLTESSSWKLLVRPQDCLTWACRVTNEFFRIGLPKEMEVSFPSMPAAPPLGIAADIRGHILQSDIVCPAATWAMLGEYLTSLSKTR